MTKISCLLSGRIDSRSKGHYPPDDDNCRANFLKKISKPDAHADGGKKKKKSKHSFGWKKNGGKSIFFSCWRKKTNIPHLNFFFLPSNISSFIDHDSDNSKQESVCIVGRAHYWNHWSLYISDETNDVLKWRNGVIGRL